MAASGEGEAERPQMLFELVLELGFGVEVEMVVRLRVLRVLLVTMLTLLLLLG